MLEVGRLCVKIAGREAGQKCVVVDSLDENFVTIDGNVRRKRCNIAHLEPLKGTLEIGKGASREEVMEAFKEAGIFKEQQKVTRKEKAAKPKKEETAKPKEQKSLKKSEAKKESKPKEQNA